MPFKSEKQRKWMHTNEPEMAKKWEKEESIDEANASVIRKKLLKQFGDDPLYKDFIIAKTPKEQKKALKTLKSIRGFNAVRLMQKYVKKLQDESIKGKLRNLIKQEIKSVNEGWWEDLSDKAQAAYIKKHGEAPGSAGGDEDDMGAHIRKTVAKGKKGRAKMKKLNRDWDAKTSTASDIAKDMGGNMTGAVKKIEKIKKGLSDDPKVKAALRKANESINEGFEKYHLGSVTNSKLSKRLQRAITVWGGKVDAVGQDYIKFRLSSSEVTKFPMLLKKLDQKKNVWIGDKRKKNIWDRRKKIDKLREGRILRAKQMVFLPGEKIYFDPMTTYFWTMGPHGGPDLDDDPIEPSEKYLYQKIIKKLKSKDKAILKKAMRTRKRRKEATTSVSVPGYLSPKAFSKSTQKAIDVDDEDDEKSESMVAPFRRRKSRGLGRPMKVGLNEGKWSKIMRSVRKGSKSGPWSIVVYKNKKVKHQRLVKILQQIPAHYEDVKKKYPRDKIGIDDKYGERVYTESVNESDLGLSYKRGKTVKVTHKKSGKELIIIDKPNVKREYEKIGYFAEGKVNELSMAPFSSSEARLHINADIKDMSKLLGKTSQKVIKIMMDGVKGGKYTAMDISRGIKEGPASRTHFGEMTFIQSLWNKMREKFRRYSKDRKLS